ncbi:MAG: phosphoribosyl-ATP diphosphatase [Betaproteobacteria bacterium]|nr:phosphoribosyl-ATP diphosphatase [Betaproteobacteria bacterium]
MGAWPVSDDSLKRLALVIAQRRGADPELSYVARLLSKGEDSILKKIGEEATECVMAAKDGDRQRIVSECADLWFHCLVMLEHYGLGPSEVIAELARREGLSGLDEKAARKASAREAYGASPDE